MTPHTTMTCPVPADARVQFDIGGGYLYVEIARHVAWGPGTGPNGEERVLRYATLATTDDDVDTLPTRTAALAQ